MALRGWKAVAAGVAVAGCVGVVTLGGLAAYTFSGMGALVDGQVVPGGAVVVKDSYSSVGLFPLPDGTVALVDAGKDPGAAAISAALTRAGRSPADVTAIFLTHGHPDHTGGCANFAAATTYTLAAELPILRGEAKPQGPIPRLFPAEASACPRLSAVADGDVVTVGGVGFQALAVPGHTAGSVAWRVGPTLFLGDSADVAADGTLLGAKWLFSDDVVVNRDALLALQGRVDGVETLVFSHSGTAPAAALRSFR